ncbi:hypothetical protein PIB30_065598 [Stylosanthes scabra]|uniref:Uncharacterized protein n=1 Tax=Stylosanthes scabra TaxID=79078 RepID=A0ABU6RMK7_9FABA|nr:hypothetical protein [Stylosanthes scabra]
MNNLITKYKPKPTPPVTKLSTSSRRKVVNAHVREKDSSSSSDSYESTEDGLYKPLAYKLLNFKHASRGDWKKGKRAIIMEDDENVVENSNEEIDWAAVLGRNEDDNAYDAFDPVHDDSDGKDSLKSEELKTPQILRMNGMKKNLMTTSPCSLRVAVLEN